MKAYGGKDYDIEMINCRDEFKIVKESHPDVPLNFLLKTDALRRGVTFSKGALDAVQDPKIYDLSISIEFQWHMLDETGDFSIPYTFSLSDGSSVGTRVAPPENDPYLIDLKDNKFMICWPDGEPIQEIFFRIPAHHNGKILSNGIEAEMIAHYVIDGFYFVPTHHCAYWNKDEQCRFCDLDYNAKHQMKMGRGFKTRQTPDDLYEATCAVLEQKGRWAHCFLNSGSDPREDYSRDFEYNLACVSAINKGAKDTIGVERFPIYLLMAPQSKERMQQIYDAGCGAVGSYIETWDPEHFKLVCPGKSNHIGRDEYIQRTVDAVDIFGRGNVAFGFVPGIEMAPPPYGFEDVEDALVSTLSGYEFMIDKGIVPLGTNWSVEPGTDFYKMGAKQPPLEFWVRLDKGRFKLLKDYQAKYGEGIAADYLCYEVQCWSCYSDYQRLL